MDSIDGKRQVLIFELGELQVYSFQSQEEIDTRASHQLVYWQHKHSGSTYGPFGSIYDCTSHYTRMKSTQDNKNDPTLAPVIYYDFTNKRRINLK